MNFIIDKKNFLSALQNISYAVRDNKTIPAISGILITANDNIVEIESTDLEMRISAKLAAKINTPGKVLMKMSTLQDYLREIDEDNITFKQVNNEITITTSQSNSSYLIMNANEFPTTPSLDYTDSCSINADKLVEGIEKTILGASTTPDNLALHSIRLDIANDSMKLVTSDTYRLFYFEEKIKSGKTNIKASLPLKTAISLVKIIKSNNLKKIDIFYNKNTIFFKLDQVDLLSKLIDLPYPDYENIINNFKYDKEVICDNNEFIKMLKRVQIFAKDNSDVKNGAKFDFKERSLEVEAISNEAKVTESISIVKKGENINIALNVRFVLDFLQQISSTIILKMYNENSAIMLTDNSDKRLLCITMPLSLR